MEYFTRSEWGAKPPKSRRAMPPKQVTHFFLHHAAATYPNGKKAMQAIQKFHQDSRGWADFAYNWGVDENGNIWEGRGWGAQGGHTKGWNSNSVAVCYMGDGSKPVSKAALKAIMTVANEADAYFGKNLIRQGHRDVGPTACPGDVLYEWWKANATSREDASQRLSDAPSEEKVKREGYAYPDLRDGWIRHLKFLRSKRPR